LFYFVKKALVGVKTRKHHITCSWILLACFVAGQFMVYAHQHNLSVAGSKSIFITVSKNKPLQTVKEKCQLCDAMLHNAMVINTQVYFNPVIAGRHVFKPFAYNFNSIQLIHSSGRDPPAPNFAA